MIILLTIFVSAVTSEAFAVTTSRTATTTTTTTITQITTPLFLSTANDENNNMAFAARRRSNAGRSTSRLNLIHKIPYGGAVKTASSPSSPSTSTSTSLFTAASGNDAADKCPFSKSMAIFGSVWGSFGVIYILAKAIMRVAPIAYEPFMGASSTLPAFSTIQWR
jgi:hypothetical protein